MVLAGRKAGWSLRLRLRSGLRQSRARFARGGLLYVPETVPSIKGRVKDAASSDSQRMRFSVRSTHCDLKEIGCK